MYGDESDGVEQAKPEAEPPVTCKGLELMKVNKTAPRVSIKVGYWRSTPACKTSYRCLLSPRADARNAENYISKRLDFKLFVGEHAHRSP